MKFFEIQMFFNHQEQTMEWKLPSEEQAYERLPWTRGRCFNILVSTVIFLNTAPRPR